VLLRAIALVHKQRNMHTCREIDKKELRASAHTRTHTHTYTHTQESTRHTEAMDAITTYLGYGSYEEWDEDQRIDWLVGELQARYGGVCVLYTCATCVQFCELL